MKNLFYLLIPFNFIFWLQHPEFGQGAGFLPNDIMLCELSGVPDTSGNVAAAELAEGDEDYAGSLAIISGWGDTCTGELNYNLCMHVRHIKLHVSTH